MTTLPRKPPTWLMTALIASAAGAYVWFVVLPMQKTISKSQAELQDRRAFVLQGDRLQTTLLEREAMLGQTREFNRQWTEQVGNRGSLGSLLADVTSLAKREKLGIRRLEPREAASLESLKRSTVEIAVVGDFSRIKSFIYGIESLAAATWVSHVSLQPASATSEAVLCEMELTVFADKEKLSG